MNLFSITKSLKPIITINNADFTINNLSLFLPAKKYYDIAKEIEINKIKIIFKNENTKRAYLFFDYNHFLNNINKGLSIVLIFDKNTNYLIDADKYFSISRTNLKTSSNNYYNGDYIFYFITEKEFLDNNKYSAIIDKNKIIFSPIENSMAIEIELNSKVANEIKDILKENYDIFLFEKLSYKTANNEIKVSNNYVEYSENNVKMHLLHKKETNKEIEVELELETMPNDKKAVKYSVYENGKLKKSSTHEIDENNIHLVIPRLINIKRKDAKAIWDELNERGKVKIRRKIGRKDEIYMHKESNLISIENRPKILKINNNLYTLVNDINAFKNNLKIAFLPTEIKIPFNILTQIFPLDITNLNGKVNYIIYKKANNLFDYYSDKLILKNVNIYDLLFEKQIQENSDIKLAYVNDNEIYAIDTKRNKKVMILIDNYGDYNQIAKELNKKLNFDKQIISEYDIKKLLQSEDNKAIKQASVKYYQEKEVPYFEIKTIKYSNDNNAYQYIKLQINKDAYTLLNDVKFASYKDNFVPVMFAHKNCIYGKYSIKYNNYEYSITKADSKIKFSKTKIANDNKNEIIVNLYAIFNDDSILRQIKNENLKKYARYDDIGNVIFEINGVIKEKVIVDNIKKANLNKNEIKNIINSANIVLLNNYIIKKFASDKLNKYKISKIEDDNNLSIIIENLNNNNEKYVIKNLSKVNEILEKLSNYDNEIINNVFLGKKISIDNEGINLMLIPSVFGPQSTQSVISNIPLPIVINLPLQQDVIPPLSLLLSKIYSINYIPVPEMPILDKLPTMFAGIIRQQDNPDVITGIAKMFQTNKSANIILDDDFEISNGKKIKILLQASDDTNLQIIKSSKLEYKYYDIVNKKAYDLLTIKQYFDYIDKDKDNAIINFSSGYIKNIYNGKLADNNGIEVGDNYILIKSPDNKKFVYIQYDKGDNYERQKTISFAIDDNVNNNWLIMEDEDNLDDIDDDNTQCIYDSTNKILYVNNENIADKLIPIAFNIPPEVIEKINNIYDDIIKIAHDITPLYANDEYTSAFDLTLLEQVIEEVAQVDPFMAQIFELVVNLNEYPEAINNLIDAIKYTKKMIGVLMIFSVISDTPLQYSFLNNLLMRLYELEKNLNAIANDIIRKYYITKEVQAKLQKQGKKLAK